MTRSMRGAGRLSGLGCALAVVLGAGAARAQSDEQPLMTVTIDVDSSEPELLGAPVPLIVETRRGVTFLGLRHDNEVQRTMFLDDAGQISNDSTLRVFQAHRGQRYSVRWTDMSDRVRVRSFVMSSVGARIVLDLPAPRAHRASTWLGGMGGLSVGLGVVLTLYGLVGSTGCFYCSRTPWDVTVGAGLVGFFSGIVSLIVVKPLGKWGRFRMTSLAGEPSEVSLGVTAAATPGGGVFGVSLTF